MALGVLLASSGRVSPVATRSRWRIVRWPVAVNVAVPVVHCAYMGTAAEVWAVGIQADSVGGLARARRCQGARPSQAVPCELRKGTLCLQTAS